MMVKVTIMIPSLAIHISMAYGKICDNISGSFVRATITKVTMDKVETLNFSRITTKDYRWALMIMKIAVG